uniref:Putative secreted protein n=1 Tax=Ixodes ricinus TaxID=34613 RepID=A0A6B0UAH1_IXORI
MVAIFVSLLGLVPLFCSHVSRLPHHCHSCAWHVPPQQVIEPEDLDVHWVSPCMESHLFSACLATWLLFHRAPRCVSFPLKWASC